MTKTCLWSASGRRSYSTKSMPFRTGCVRMSARRLASRHMGPSSTSVGIWSLLHWSRWREHIPAWAAPGSFTVDDSHSEFRFHRLHVHGFDLNDRIQPTLESTLNKELRRRGKRIAVGHEHQLFDAATEIGAVHTFTRIGEQDLEDHVADVLIFGGLRGPAAAV